MNDIQELIKGARRLAVTDRESREPVVRAMQRLADALEALNRENEAMRPAFEFRFEEWQVSPWVEVSS